MLYMGGDRAPVVSHSNNHAALEFSVTYIDYIDTSSSIACTVLSSRGSFFMREPHIIRENMVAYCYNYLPVM